MLKRRESFLKERKGAVLLEFVLCFPILLVLFLFAMQLAQILIRSSAMTMVPSSSKRLMPLPASLSAPSRMMGR